MKSVVFWLVAVLLTIASAVYQRATGPTYPIKGEGELLGSQIEYKFDRSHQGQTDHIVSVETGDSDINGIVEWKRHKTDDAWTAVPMEYADGVLSAPIPGQPKAGKLDYIVRLNKDGSELTLPADDIVTIRYTGEVPMFILIPHIIFMFATMLLSTRTGLEVFMKKPRLKLYALWTIVTLFVGGFILGPAVQLYAFDAWWTGFPFGTDLTDNKTLIALIFWLIALFAIYKFEKPKGWVLAASIVMLIIFLIPHSMLGSEIDYNELDKLQKHQEELVE